MRADEVRPCLSVEDVLRNAPKVDGAYFKVKAIQE